MAEYFDIVHQGKSKCFNKIVPDMALCLDLKYNLPNHVTSRCYAADDSFSRRFEKINSVFFFLPIG